MHALLQQMPALIGVVIGALASFLTGAATERATRPTRGVLMRSLPQLNRFSMLGITEFGNGFGS